MASLKLKDSKNKDLNEIEVKDEVFAEKRRRHIIAEVVRYQRAKRRRGTVGAKTRSFISRSGAKPFAQKGTGRARQGDVRSPHMEGGGVAFAPIAKDWSFKLNRKARKTALCSVISDKFKSAKLVVLEEHGLKGIKTKDVKALMTGLGLNKALVVVSDNDEVLEKSIRNLKDYKALRVGGLNVMDVLHYEHLVLMKDSVSMIEERLA